MVDRVGQQLGNYRLVRLLGRGGFAEVYLGEHVYIGTQAAIKVLTTHLTGQDSEQFRVEATTLAHLQHPHIVRVLEFGVEETTPFLVIEYAPGGSLRARYPQGNRLELSTVVSYINQAASALQYAHDQKLIHRDVKPENLLLKRDQEVLLSDFGIALVMQTSRDQLTQPTTGTVAYMAPEQIHGKPQPASDQYALGIIVYEWLTGTLPFSGSVFVLFAQHLHASPTPLHEKVPDIPPAVEHVVLRALAKDPKQRFPTVQAFATALEQASRDARSSVAVSGNSTLPTTIPPKEASPLPLSPRAPTEPRSSLPPTPVASFAISEASIETHMPRQTTLYSEEATVISHAPVLAKTTTGADVARTQKKTLTSQQKQRATKLGGRIRRWYLVAIALAVLLCGAAIFAIHPWDTGAPNTFPTPLANHTMGEQVSVSPWLITVTAYVSSGDNSYMPKSGNALLVINVNQHNQGSQAATTGGAHDWNLRDSSGTTFPLITQSGYGTFPSASVAANETTTGTLVYEVPTGTQHFLLTFAPPTGGYQTTWDVPLG